MIAKIVGSNFSLTGKIVSIQAAKPFLAPPFSAEFLRLCGVVEEVRTFSGDGEKRPKEIQRGINRYLKRLRETLEDPDCEKLGEQLHVLHEHMTEASLQQAA